MGSGVFLTYKDAGMREDAGRDEAARHAAIAGFPHFPIPLGKHLPGLSLSQGTGHASHHSWALLSPRTNLRTLQLPPLPSPTMVLWPQSWVSAPWPPCKMGPGCLLSSVLGRLCSRTPWERALMGGA